MLGAKTPGVPERTTSFPRPLPNHSRGGANELRGAGPRNSAQIMRSGPTPPILFPPTGRTVAPIPHSPRSRVQPGCPDDWICEKISGYRKQDPQKKDGVPQWKAQWQGFSRAHDSWEPATSFLPNYHPDWAKYIQDHKISLDLRTCLPATGHVARK